MAEIKDTSTEEGFGFDSIKEFDEHIDKSIVGYGELLQDIVTVSDYFVEPRTNVYDIGCSTGKLMKTLAAKYPESTMIGIEPENNFKGHLKTEYNCQFVFDDVFNVPFINTNLVTSVFTLQFIAQHQRGKVAKKVYDSLNVGGCFVLCEKMLSTNSKFQDILSSMFNHRKREQFSDKAIFEKEQALRHQMKLFTLEDNIAMLKAAGFTKIQIFWKRYLFTGLIAIK